MALLDTTLRNAFCTSVKTRADGGIMYICNSSFAGTLTTPNSGDILSQHDIGATPGSVSSGALTLTDSDISADSSANNTGTPAYVVLEDSSTNVFAVFQAGVDVTISLAGGETTIVAGAQVTPTSLVITDGNA